MSGIEPGPGLGTVFQPEIGPGPNGAGAAARAAHCGRCRGGGGLR